MRLPGLSKDAFACARRSLCLRAPGGASSPFFCCEHETHPGKQKEKEKRVADSSTVDVTASEDDHEAEEPRFPVPSHPNTKHFPTRPPKHLNHPPQKPSNPT